VCLLCETQAADIVGLYNGVKLFLKTYEPKTIKKPNYLDITIEYDVLLKFRFQSIIIDWKYLTTIQKNLKLCGL
jgi:hypothetical protein